jgi:pimeloyl-ACP methyl ester carboxylesterase
VCSEDAPRWQQENVSTQAVAATYLGSAFMESMQAVCSIWPQGLVDSDFNTPRELSIPTLILSGANDPVTPAAYGERAVKLYPKGTHWVVTGQGHGQLAVGCMPRLLRDFMAAASAASIDASCLKQVAPAPFMLSASGPAP